MTGTTKDLLGNDLTDDEQQLVDLYQLSLIHI